ncbi:oligosaccharide flippase family protein [Gracilibacillus sp. YIM 98692]|uniref:oligosaccharide flippase family protein n=1 Tax=Gracilibacillus sp. YIM 98692 TaxID=2663532 RepID=UPI0013D738A2|nr:oligosaccharide flippase family protein [Gracilibacillus sp. YIM 98692]
MKVNQIKAGVILSYIEVGIKFIIGLLFVPILLHYLGQDEYGLYQLMGSIIAYMAIIDFGLSSTITRYYSKYIAKDNEKNKENILGIAAVLYFSITLISIIISIIIYQYLDSIFKNSLTPSELISAKKIFIIVIINIGLSIGSQFFRAIINSHEKFIFMRTLILVKSIVTPVAIIAILSFEANAFNVVLTQTFFNLLIIIIMVFYSFSKIKIKVKLHYLDIPLLKEMFGFSFFIFITAITDQIFWRSDQIILGIVAGTSSVAIYAIASQIVLNYTNLSTAMSGIFLPNVTKRVERNASDNELTNLFIKIGRLQYLLLLCVLMGFILFGKQFINLWVGEEFYTSYYITLIIMIPFTIDLIQNMGLIILKAKNLYAYRAKVFLVIAIINIVMTVPLAIALGGIGAAIASGISYFVGNAIIMNIYYFKKVKIDVVKFWKEILNITLPLLIVFFIGFFIEKINFYPDISNLGVKITLFMIIYFVIAWFLAMNSFEKELLIKPFRKILRKIVRKI